MSLHPITGQHLSASFSLRWQTSSVILHLEEHVGRLCLIDDESSGFFGVVLTLTFHFVHFLCLLLLLSFPLSASQSLRAHSLELENIESGVKISATYVPLSCQFCTQRRPHKALLHTKLKRTLFLQNYQGLR